MAEFHLATNVGFSKAPKEWKMVRASENYRTFLKSYLEEASLSLSDLARAAGFGRGFPGDVISGKRRITAKSYHSFEKALKLPQSGRKLFKYLVAREEPDVFPELDPVVVARGIDDLRAKPWGHSRRDVAESRAPDVARLFRDPKSVLVYTASGRPGRGATLEEISKRTSLPPEELVAVVKALESAGMIKFQESESRYEPQDLHLFMRADKQSELFLGIFRTACLEAAERAPQALRSEQEFFFTSTFCIREDQLSELKSALRETILKFVDDSICDDGDKIVRLTTALHR